MSDLVERLRNYRTEDETRYEIEHDICYEAAAEIERLRADAERYRWLRASKYNMRDTADFGWVGFSYDCRNFGFDADNQEERAKALDAAIDARLATQEREAPTA